MKLHMTVQAAIEIAIVALYAEERFTLVNYHVRASTESSTEPLFFRCNGLKPIYACDRYLFKFVPLERPQVDHVVSDLLRAALQM